MAERATASSRSEKSAEAAVVTGWAGEAEAGDEGPNEKECSASCRCGRQCVRRPCKRVLKGNRKMKPQPFINVKVVDGKSAPTFIGEARVEGNLSSVAPKVVSVHQRPTRVHTARGAQGALLATGHFGRVVGCWAHRNIGLHAHDEIQITFNLGGGRLHFTIDDALVVVTPGQGAIIPSWVKHSRDVDPTVPTYLIVMAISPAWLHAHDKAGYNISGGVEVFTVPGSLEKILAHLRLSLTNPGLDASEQVAVLVGALIDGVGSMGSLGPLLNPVNLTGHWDKRILDAATCIQKRNGRTNVDHLAKEYGLSRSHFYSRFCAHFGFSPQLLINAVRMKTALHLLLQSDDSIATISDILDFSTPGHFTRFFTKHTGETPMSYRTRNLTIESL
jgi:AraC-like DNA-binding protein